MNQLSKGVFLSGPLVSLRALNEIDIEGNYSSWLNNKLVTQFNSHGRFPMTVNRLRQYVADAISSDKQLVLAVIYNATKEHVGNISLQNINWIDRNAEIAFLLGETAYWGKGIMYEAADLLIAHAFDTLNLHRIYCGTSAENKGMQRLAEKLGMVCEGRRKDAIYKKGSYCDIIEYGIINKNESECAH